MIAPAPAKVRSRLSEDRVVSAYFAELDRHVLVSLEEEQELFRRYHAGDVSAKRKIILSNLRFVVKVAQRYVGTGIPLADLISEGNKGLIHAVDKFEPDKNFKFISYAVWWIRQTILKSISEQSRFVYIPLNQTQRIVRITKSIEKLLQVGRRVPTPDDIAADSGLSLAIVLSMLKIINPTQSLDTPVGERGNVLLVDILEAENEDPLESMTAMEVSDELHEAMKFLTDTERTVLMYCFGFHDDYLYTLQDVGSRLGVSRERIRQVRDKACIKLRNIMLQKVAS